MNFRVAGIDEAGRGPLAGPVTAACVCLKPGFRHPEIADSKKLTHEKRAKLEPLIKENSLAYAVISVGQHRIDRLNIRESTRLAMRLAAEKVVRLLRKEDPASRFIFLIDGNMLMSSEYSQEAIVKGDDKLLAISAASILAKVQRDRIMDVLDKKYSGYGFEKHKGYPTAFHRSQVESLGPSPVHRRSFAGVVEFLKN